jgi:hypothetical protein
MELSTGTMEVAMRVTALALSTLLLGAGVPVADAQAAMTQGYSADPVSAGTKMPPRATQLAESNQRSPNKLADKYLAGRAGGFYGIGSTRSVVFKKKK